MEVVIQVKNVNVTEEIIFRGQTMKKSFTSVEWMLVIAITIILVIGLVATIQLFFPWLEWTSCIQLQRSNIDKVNTAIEEVLLNGEEQIVRFEVERCVTCIWYNSTDSTLVVEYEASNETFSTPRPWTGTIDIGNGGKPTCNSDNLVGEKTCEVYIAVNRVEVVCL